MVRVWDLRTETLEQKEIRRDILQQHIDYLNTLGDFTTFDRMEHDRAIKDIVKLRRQIEKMRTTQTTVTVDKGDRNGQSDLS